MKTIERPEARSSPTTCARCGSEFSSIDDVETFCATCLLHTALIDEDAGHAARLHRFDQYELMTGDDGAPVELGRGAMGVTYKAFDTNLRYEVALKVIHPRYLADESSRARFLSEARAAAQLRHRNIASVFHLGSERDEYFYAMELVDGETIQEWVHHKGPLDCATALEVTLQITRALIATGGRRFVHRDIKPSNIMLCTEADGAIVAKLIDFGLVRAIADQTVTGNTAPTRHGFIGTPHFASPEQFAGQPTDARSDIYSLGVTLWFMLTGKAPFDGTRNEIQHQQITGVLPLHQLKGIPRAVIDLIKRLLAVDAAKRPQSPGELKEQLNNCIGAIDIVKQKQHRRFAYSAMAATVVITGLLAASYILQRKPVSLVTNEIVPEKSLAVLPFENLSEEKEYASFADGVQDEILTDLAQIADLKVISRTSVTHYKTGIARNLAEIGRQLGVAHVVEGNVQRSGNHVHVYAQLLDVRTNRRLWEQTYDRDLSNVFAIHSEIAKAVAEQLHVTLSPVEKNAIERQPTTNVNAFDLYTRAKNLVVKEGIDNSKAILLPAIDLLDQAITRDPTFLDAYCLVAWAHDLLYFVGDDHTPARLALAEAAIEGASRLHPEAGQTHLARAWNLHWGHLDYNGALAELEIARRSLPNDEQIPRLAGYIYRRQGRWEDSARSLERAIELDPRNVGTLQQIALSYGHLSRYAEEEQALDRVLAIEPNDIATKLERAGIEMDWRADTRPLHQAIDSVRAKNPAALATVADSWLICALAERDVVAANQALIACSPEEAPLSNQAIHFSRPFIQGVIARMNKEDDKARAAFTAARVEQEKIIQAQPDYGPALCVLGLIDAALGRKEEALNEGHRAVELLPVEKDALDGPLMIKYLAMIAAWAGDKDLACDQLAIAVHSPSGPSYGAVKLLPWWDPLRGDPRFEKIVASLGPGGSAENEDIPEKSIAVLPFANRSSDSGNAYFADGIQDEILTRLSKIADLKVISRTSTQRYKSAPDNLPEIARQLGVAHLLEGSVQKIGDAVRVNVQLVKAINGSYVWANTFDRKLTDIFSVESEVAKAIADQLRAKLTGQEEKVIAAKPTNNPEAYDAYLRGLAFEARYYSSGFPTDLEKKAISFFERAAQLDPNFAPAWARLSRANADLYYFQIPPNPATWRDAAERALETAQKLEPNSPETLLALGYYQFWVLPGPNIVLGDYGAAKRTFGRVGTILPNSSEVPNALALIARREGHWEESTAYFEQALALDPRNVEVLNGAGMTYIWFRQFKVALKLCDRVLDITPNDPDTMTAKAGIYQAQGNLQEAARWLPDINCQTSPSTACDARIIQLRLERNYGEAVQLLQARLAQFHYATEEIKALDRVWLAFMQRLAGDTTGAKIAAEQARNTFEQLYRDEPDNPFGPAWLSNAYALMGEKDLALKLAERAVMLTRGKTAVRGPAMEENLALIQTMFGENSRAISTLTPLLQTPYESLGSVGISAPITPALLRLDPIWDPLRSDPAFQKLCEEKQP